MMGERQKQTPDWCYDADDWECTYDWANRDLIVDDRDPDEIVEVKCLIEAPSKFATALPEGFDDDGSWDGWEWHWFDSREEAEAAQKGANEKQSEIERAAKPVGHSMPKPL